jgi:mono/diheme cytochrome c family protein
MTGRFLLAYGLLAAATVTSTASLSAGVQPQSAAAARGASPANVRAVITEYCVSCHNARARIGGLALDPAALDAAPLDAEVWEKVVRKMRTRAMPPAGARRPDEATYAHVVSSLETALDNGAAPPPSRAVLHRLNRAEYANAVRDLLALDFDASPLFPPDDSADGFDTNAALLGVSPLLLERYLSAAATISSLAVGDPQINPKTETYRIRADASQTQHVDGLPLGTRGGLVVRHWFPLDAEYVVTVKLLETGLGAIRGLERPHDVEIVVDGKSVHRATVGGKDDYTASVASNTSNIKEVIHGRLRVRVPVKAGPRTIGATFVEKTAAQGGSRVQPFVRSTVMATDHTGLPHIESVTIAGPFDASAAADTPSRRRIFACQPANAGDDRCARQIVATLARRAYRRPATDTEVARLMTFFTQGSRGGGFEKGIQLALRTILASPQFVFRAENEASTAARTSQAADDFDLASRLSFFLWSSIPDDELLTVAERGQLRVPAMLQRQVRRMLADSRAEALVRNFAGQWLHLRNLQTSAPDRYQFPDFDDNLRQAFRREVELFFWSIMRDDRSVLGLLTADYTFVNERLARHYGIPHVYGSHFRRVTLADDARKGLLGKGGILLVTSHPDRTSPVKRGQWILENLLGTPPPPPPPDVPALEESDEPGRQLTMRERMERHRANPVCASCHKIMDPLGLAMENYDAVGLWRSHEGGNVIDATGELVDGTKIDGPVKLRQALLQRPQNFVQTLAEKLLTYGLRRSLEARDMPAVRAIVREAGAEDYRFSSLVAAIAASQPFQMRPTVAARAPAAAARGETRTLPN